MNESRVVGTVFRVVPDRGFAFVEFDHHAGGDGFLHVHELLDPADGLLIVPGARVECDLEQTPKGLRCRRVAIVSEAANV